MRCERCRRQEEMLRGRRRRAAPPVMADTALTRMLDEMAKDLSEIARRAATGV
jgi:hypothetical protein